MVQPWPPLYTPPGIYNLGVGPQNSIASVGGGGGSASVTWINELLRSEEVDNASWVKGTPDVTVTPNNTLAPYGGFTSAELLTEIATSSSHGVSQTVTSQTTATFSIYVKDTGSGRGFFNMLTYNLSGSNVVVTFNTITGAKTQTILTGAVHTVISASSESAGNGWFRCQMTTTRASGSNLYGAYFATTGTPTISSGVESYLGDISKTMYLWGAQVVSGLAAGPYIVRTT